MPLRSLVSGFFTTTMRTRPGTNVLIRSCARDHSHAQSTGMISTLTVPSLVTFTEMNRLALLIPMVLACSSPSTQIVPPDGGSSATGGAAGGSSSGNGGVSGSGGAGGADQVCSDSICGCVSPCALFELDITSTTSPRINIEECRLTITDQNGNLALDNYLLHVVAGADSNGNPVLVSGCAGGLTAVNIGTFTYTTSLTSGSLTFQVNALDTNGNIVQTGSSTQNIEAFPPKISVPLTISAPTP